MIPEKAKQSKAFDWFRSFMRRHPAWFMFWHWLLTVNGQIACFWMKPRITRQQIDECLVVLKPGDVIGTYSRRFPTAWYLPKGKHGVEHSMVYLGGGRVAESVTPCVRIALLREVLSHYDKVVVGKLIPGADRAAIVEYARNARGRMYDTMLDNQDSLLYCHELTAFALMAGGLKPTRAGMFWLFDDFENCFEKTITFG